MPFGLGIAAIGYSLQTQAMGRFQVRDEACTKLYKGRTQKRARKGSGREKREVVFCKLSCKTFLIAHGIHCPMPRRNISIREKAYDEGGNGSFCESVYWLFKVTPGFLDMPLQTQPLVLL